MDAQKVESCIYVISESYNLSLFDLYCTSQAEKTNLSEEFLIETSFQVLKALEYLNRQSNHGQPDEASSNASYNAGPLPKRGTTRKNFFAGGFQGMLRMQSILFDDNGQVKLQEMSNLHFDEYEVNERDIMFLPPEVLKSGHLSSSNNHGRRTKGSILGSNFQLNSSMDVWTLGMILLHCSCLEYSKTEETVDTFEEIVNLFMKMQNGSLINLEDKLDMEQMEAEENGSDKGKDHISESSHQNQNDDDKTKKPKDKSGGNWIDFYSKGSGNNDSQISKFLNLKLFEKQNFSAKFIDFLRECLMFDPRDRMKPFDLLSHPVFRKYNKIYLSQQLVLTRPITKVERHHLQKLRW